MRYFGYKFLDTNIYLNYC